MPFRSQAQRRFMYAKHPNIAKRWTKEYPDQGRLPQKVKAKTKRVPIIVDKKRKTPNFGETFYDKKNKPTKVNIYLKTHFKKGKLDKAELASTIKHELMHVAHPTMTEKKIYKATAKTKIPEKEQDKLIAKLPKRKINYKVGALKRKFKMKASEGKEPGSFINQANLKKRVAIMGLV